MLPLKEAIEVNHRKAEKMIFNERMMRGDLMRFEYNRYLFQLYGIFSSIERFPLPHTDLARTTKVLEDINELNSEMLYDMYFTPSTFSYMMHLHTLNQEQLLPHVYLNYMALMFGGQMMKEKTPGSGRIYQFDNMKDVVMSIRSIQQDSWADEANKGLQYHIYIYDELQNNPRHRSEYI